MRNARFPDNSPQGASGFDEVPVIDVCEGGDVGGDAFG